MDETRGSGVTPGAFAKVVSETITKAGEDERRRAQHAAGVPAVAPPQPGAEALGLVTIKLP